MYRIRLHGRGGQGIKTAGRVLGTAFFRAGLEAQDAPVYGAERRGAPISAHVRAARDPIRERGPITRPDLVVVADDTLVAVPAANVLLGIGERTVLLMHSAETAATWQRRLNAIGPVITLQAAPGLAGARCAGAAARLLGRISRDELEQAIVEEYGPLGKPVVAQNLEQALGAFDAAAPHAGMVREGEPVSASNYASPEWIDLPLEAARAAAPDVFAAATSLGARTGLWRTMRPEIDYARCNRCVWVCSTLCPDSAIRVRADGAPEIDYDHCKGCMICVAVCPPHAIAALPEHASVA